MSPSSTNSSSSNSVAVLQRQVTDLQRQNVTLQQQLEQSQRELQQERVKYQQLEAQMQQSAGKLQNILDSAIATITRFRVFADLDWNYDYYSAGCHAMYGFTAQELMADKMLWQSRVIPEDWDTIVQPVFQDFLQEQPVTAAFRFRHKDGSIRWISSTYISQRDDQADCWVVTVVDVDVTDRKQAELALQRSEEQLRQIGDHISDVFYLKAIDTGELLYLNPVYEEIYQQDCATLYENPDAWTERIHPEDRDRVLAQLVQERQATKFFEDEYRVLRPDGTIRWLWCSSFAIYNEAGEVYRFAGINRDITHHKLAEINLIASEARFRSLVEQATVGLCYTNPAGQFILVNSKYSEMLGYSIPELLTMTFMDVTHPDDLEADLDQTRRLTTGEIDQFDLEKRFIRQDGTVIWVRLTLCAVQEETGQPRSHLGIVQDITQQRRLQAEQQVTLAALAESEVKFRKLFEQMPVGVSYANPDGRFLMANSKYCDIVGYSAAELLSKTFMEVTHPADLATDLMQDSQMFAGSIPQFSMEKRFIRKDGSYVWTEVLVSIMADSQGKPKYSIAITQDITERKQLEADRAATESELRRYRRIIEATTDGMYLVDRSYIYRLVNPTYLDLVGKQADEVLGRSIADLRGKETFHIIQQRLDRAFDGEAVFYEAWFYFKPVGHRFMSITYVPYIETDSVISGVVVSLRDITGLKQAEAALRLSEEQRRLALDVTHIGSWDWYPSTEQVLWNDNHYHLLGLPVGDGVATYHQWRDRVHPDDLERTENALFHALKTQTNYENEHRVIYPDGTLRWVVGKGRGIYDDQGLPTRMIGILMDITEQKQAEAKLRMQSWRSQLFADLTLKIRQSLNLQDTLQTTVTELQLLLQADRVLLYQLASSGTGMVVQEALADGFPGILGQTIIDHCLQKTCIDQYRQGRVKAIADVQTADIQPCHRDFLSQFGVRANLAVPILIGGVDPNATPAAKKDLVLWGLLLAHQGQPRQWSEFEADLLQQLGNQLGIAIGRSQLLAALQASEAKFSGILDMASDAIISINPQQQITLFNQGAERQFGYQAEEVLGHPFNLLLPDRLQTLYRRYTQKFVQNRIQVLKRNKTMEIVVRRKDGTEFPAEASFSRLLVPGETIYTVILRDVTERQQAAAALLQKAQQEQTLTRIIQIVRSSLDLETVFAAAAIEVGQLLEANRAVIFQHCTQEQLWRPVGEYFQAPDTALYPHFQVPDRNLLAQQLQQGEIVRVNDTNTLEDAGTRAIAAQYPGAWLLVPLFVNQVVWGSFVLQKSEPFIWQDHQAELAQTIANQLGIAIQQAELYQQAQQELAERRRAEINLQDRETQLQAIGNNLPKGAIFQLVHDPAQGFYFTYYSAGIEQLLGIQPQAILQDASLLFDLLLEEERDRHDYLLQKSLHHLTLFEMEMRQYHAITGEIKWSSVRSSPRRLTDGRTVWDGIEVDITQLKQTEAALQRLNQHLEQRVQERTAQLRIAMTAARMGSWELNLSTHIEYWSPQFCELLGIRTNGLGQLLDLNGIAYPQGPSHELFIHYVHPDDRSLVEQTFQQTLSQGTIYDCEFRVCKPDGSQCWFYSRGAYQYDDQGIPIKLSGISMDITDRKQADEALRQSEEQFRTVFDTAPIAISLVDVQTFRIVRVNATHRQLFGYSKAELETMTLMDFTHPDDIASNLDYIQQLREGEISHFNMEKRFFKKDGTLVWTKLTVALLRTPDGLPRYTLGMIEDITEAKWIEAERQLTEAALRESEERFRSVFDHAPIGMAVANVKNYRFTTVNPAFCQLLGYSEAEMLAINGELVSHSEDFDAERPYSIALLNGEIDSYQMEKRYVKQDGTILVGHLTTKAMRSDAGNTLKILGMVQDISDRKRAEEQLRASLLEKEVLLKEIHHRVKNNLQVISSLLSMQARTIQDPAMREPLVESQRRVRVMAVIHEHLYQTGNLAQIDVADHVRNLVSNLLRSYVPEGAAIAIRTELDCAMLGVDATIPCGLIINELVSNAIKYAFPHQAAGEITVMFRSNAFNHHCLIVRDNGIGFPEDLDFRNSKSLGLKIVTALTKQLGGSISLTRENGTTVAIQFTT